MVVALAQNVHCRAGSLEVEWMLSKYGCESEPPAFWFTWNNISLGETKGAQKITRAEALSGKYEGAIRRVLKRRNEVARALDLIDDEGNLTELGKIVNKAKDIPPFGRF